MSTIAEKLQKALDNKAAIKAAIIAKGQECGDDMSQYADAITAIQSGGLDGKVFALFRGKAKVTDTMWEESGMAEADMSAATDLSFLFSGCVNLTTIDLTAWNVGSCVAAEWMFGYTTRLTSVIGSHTIEDVDGGVSALNGMKCAIDLSQSALTLPSLAAIIRGLAEVTDSVAINFSTTQYNLLEAYTTTDYIALAKSKGWVVGCGGHSDETLAEDVAGTIIGTDADGNIKYVKYEDFVADGFDTSTFTPISVVVIPKSHTADAKCRGISLMNMSRTNPETGTNGSETMYWGVYGTDESLTNYSSLTTGNVAQGGTLGVSSTGYLPTETNTTTDSIVDTIGGAAITHYGNSTPYVPSPYGAEGIPNPQYWTGASNNKIQANTDMDGRGNTDVIIAVVAASSYNGVLVSGSGAISNTQQNYPAFTTCYRYQGAGYTDNSWYLPSCGEMGYFIARWNTINNSLTAIRNLYGTSAAALVPSTTYHWSSTEYNSGNARYLMPSTGYVNNGSKSYNYVVRAFHAF